MIQELIHLADGLTLEDIPANSIFESCNTSDPGDTAAGENYSDGTNGHNNNIMSDYSDSDEDGNVEQDDNGDDYLISKSAIGVTNDL